MLEERLKLNLTLVSEHISAIESYFEEINTCQDFVTSKSGRAYFDAILMHLQVVGEILKKCYQEYPDYFNSKGEIPWREIIRLRDLISHSYDKLQHEIIFDICETYMGPLQKVITNSLH
ncbi:MAG: DUF86 domain-containing protein [Bacteroidota bacterium]|nr:DUF86 domain-containing protein [Bacteroidota bacterium]